ncbi:glycosyltransferase [Vitreoscilla massiliensis]|uniref:Glycosyltransferase n=1 Tax=Vitreoscilla massiliensis TaxID=1689272 RepID=A0ABY4E4A6_9NEIS|nr:glycosyltransferase [Vitreoscilla massiliensis]UOO90586.1 glycosyltransferase [Vitreoscilla massiliensis]
MVKRITHLTSVHKRNDIRIFLKECVSLSNHFDVTLIVADGQGDAKESNIQILDIGKPLSRWNRMTKTSKQMFLKAASLNSDLYHIHDPELIPVGVKLLNQGFKVIFDAHEDLPKQILTKPYLHKMVRKPLALSIAYYEKLSLKKFSGIITSTSTIAAKFRLINNNVANINNYPILNELFDNVETTNEVKNTFSFVGGMTAIRGITEILDAIDYVKQPCQIAFAGEFSPLVFKQLSTAHKNFQNVDYLGQLNRVEVKNLLKTSLAGLVLYAPVPNHIDAQPNKLFEYMSAGIAVIGSNFPLWKDIIEAYSCGICVNPEDPKQIAEAINYLRDHPELAKEMGLKGRNAVINTFNWETEQQKLVSFYNKIL